MEEGICAFCGEPLEEHTDAERVSCDADLGIVRQRRCDEYRPLLRIVGSQALSAAYVAKTAQPEAWMMDYLVHALGLSEGVAHECLAEARASHSRRFFSGEPHQPIKQEAKH